MDITRHLNDHAWDIIPMSEVADAVAEVRLKWGWKPLMSKLLTLPNETHKFRKGTVPILGVAMLPQTLARPEITMCPNSTRECRQNCILYSGRGAMSTVHAGRGWKTDLLIDYPNAWFTMLNRELGNAQKHYGEDLRCRMNIFSDVHYEKLFPDDFWKGFRKVRFQDYTKGWRRLELPRNYRLVYSASEHTSVEKMRDRVESGGRVTVVFDLHKSKPFPKRWEGMRLVDGDVDDDLWSRPARSIIGLRAKGRLRKADSPFKRKVV